MRGNVFPDSLNITHHSKNMKVNLVSVDGSIDKGILTYNVKIKQFF